MKLFLKLALFLALAGLSGCDPLFAGKKNIGDAPNVTVRIEPI